MTQIIRSGNRLVMVVDSETEAKDRITSMPQYPNLTYKEWEPQKPLRHASKRSRRKVEEE